LGNRGHFIGLAAHVMRRVLVDYARQHNAERRGAGLQRVEMKDNLAISRSASTKCCCSTQPCRG